MTSEIRRITQEPIFKLRYTERQRIPIVERNDFGLLTLTERTTTGLINKDFNFKLLESISYDAPQGVVEQETITGDGGAVINTGRRIESLTLTGKFLNRQEIKFDGDNVTINTLNSFSDIRDRVLKLKEDGKPCELIGHQFLTLKNRKWIITNVNTNMNAGQNYLVFTISLKEYRQANVKRGILNLVATRDILNFKKRLALRLQS